MEIEKEERASFCIKPHEIQQIEELRRQQLYQAYALERSKIQQFAFEQGIPLDVAERQYHQWLEVQIANHNAGISSQAGQFPPNDMHNNIVVADVSPDAMYYTLAARMVPAQGMTFRSYVASNRPSEQEQAQNQVPVSPAQTMETEQMAVDASNQLWMEWNAAANAQVAAYNAQREALESQAAMRYSYQENQVPCEPANSYTDNALLRHLYMMNTRSQEEQQRLLMLSNPAAYHMGPTAPTESLQRPIMSPDFPKKLPLTAKVVREGYLMKRGEHIRNWRRRYFVLREDGTFFGFKSKPKNFLATPLNNFTVRNCKIKTYDKPKPFCFALQGLQWTTVVHRLFFVESELERRQWINSIKMVADRLKTSDAEPTDITVEEVGEGIAPVEHERKKKTRVRMEDFDLIKVLGKGTFGKVILCRMKDTGQMYAMKLLKKTVLIEKEELAHTYTECRVLHSLEHPFMTKMRYSFTTPVYLCFVMEYVNGGELFYHLNKAKRFPEDTARFYGAELTSALGYMHNVGIIYRDLKLENILLDQHGHIKIADFGLCKEEVFNGESTKTFCGTPEYLAPEVLRENDYNRAVDWWGLGVVMFEMLCGRLPFYSKDHEVLFELILNENIVTPPFLSGAARDLLAHLLIRDPTLRLGGGEADAIEVMGHIFFTTVDWERLVRREISPPWKPDVRDAYDTKYIPDEFVNETVHLTPPTEPMLASPDDVEPYFRAFSFHGSRQSLIYGSESLASTSHTDLHMGMGSPIHEALDGVDE